MNPFEMVVIIVFLVVVGGIVKSVINAREHRRDRRAEPDHEAGELRDLIVTLEERIRVLERIVTDTSGRDDLRRQFRDLER